MMVMENGHLEPLWIDHDICILPNSLIDILEEDIRREENRLGDDTSDDEDLEGLFTINEDYVISDDSLEDESE